MGTKHLDLDDDRTTLGVENELQYEAKFIAGVTLINRGIPIPV